MNERFVATLIDVGDPGVTETLRRYHIGATPNPVITDSQGNVLRQRQAGMSKTQFLELLGPLEASAAE